MFIEHLTSILHRGALEAHIGDGLLHCGNRCSVYALDPYLIIVGGVWSLFTADLIVFLLQRLQLVDVHQDAFAGLPALVPVLHHHAGHIGGDLQAFFQVAVVVIAFAVQNQLILHHIHKGLFGVAHGVGLVAIHIVIALFLGIPEGICHIGARHHAVILFAVCEGGAVAQFIAESVKRLGIDADDIGIGRIAPVAGFQPETDPAAVKRGRDLYIIHRLYFGEGFIVQLGFASAVIVDIDDGKIAPLLQHLHHGFPRTDAE